MAADMRINGVEYDTGDMTFREQREVRRIIREELAGDPDVAFDDLELPDVLPAVALVLARRDNPAFSLDDALDLKVSEIVIDADEAEEPAVPPPSRRSSAKKK